MAPIVDPKTLEQFVGSVTQEAAARLQAAATDAKRRQAALAKAKKVAGNRSRATDIRETLDAESVLLLDATALAKRVSRLEDTMRADLERLVEVARGQA